MAPSVPHLHTQASNTPCLPQLCTECCIDTIVSYCPMARLTKLFMNKYLQPSGSVSAMLTQWATQNWIHVLELAETSERVDRIILFLWRDLSLNDESKQQRRSTGWSCSTFTTIQPLHTVTKTKSQVWKGCRLLEVRVWKGFIAHC